MIERGNHHRHSPAIAQPHAADPIGARILWSGPPGLSLAAVDAPRRRSAVDAPIFGDPLAGRGDGAPVKAARPGDQVVLVQ